MAKKSIEICVALAVTLILSLPGSAAERITAFVSIAPQKYTVQQIGRDLVDVHVMVPPGASPHTYEPRPRQMVAISRARLYFGTGVGFEKKWLEKMAAVNPEMQVIHTDRGIKKRPMAADHSHREAGHQKSRQEQNSLDPHIWLAPPLVKVQARTITDALIGCDPGHRSDYEANYLELAAGIDRLDAELKKLFAGQKGLRFMVFHPSWGYFAETYGLAQVPIEIEGKEPKPAQLKALIEQARKEDIKMVFVQPQFSTKSADIIAREIGGQVAFADPLAEDWMANLRSVAVKFKAALK